MSRRLGHYDIVEENGGVRFERTTSDGKLRAASIALTIAIVAYSAVGEGEVAVRLLLFPAFLFPLAGRARALRIAAFAAATVVRRTIEIVTEGGDYRGNAGRMVVIDNRGVAASDVRDVRTLHAASSDANPTAPGHVNLYLVARTEAFKIDRAHDEAEMAALGQRLADALDVPFVKSARREPIAVGGAALGALAVFVEAFLMLLAPFGFIHSDALQHGLDRGGVTAVFVVALFAAWVLAVDAVFPVLVGLALRPGEHARARRMFED